MREPERCEGPRPAVELLWAGRRSVAAARVPSKLRRRDHRQLDVAVHARIAEDIHWIVPVKRNLHLLAKELAEHEDPTV